MFFVPFQIQNLLTVKESLKHIVITVSVLSFLNFVVLYVDFNLLAWGAMVSFLVAVGWGVLSDTSTTSI